MSSIDSNIDDPILENICISSLVFDESSLIWLSEEKLLSLLMNELVVISRSIKIPKNMYDNLDRRIISLYTDGKPSHFNAANEISKIRPMLRELNSISDVSHKNEEAKAILEAIIERPIINIYNKVVEMVSMLLVLSDTYDRILLISDDYILNMIIDIIQEKGLLKALVTHITSYEIALEFFSHCFITYDLFQTFHVNYLTSNKRNLPYQHVEIIKLILPVALEQYPDKLIKKVSLKSNHLDNLVNKVIEIKEGYRFHDFFLCFNNLDEKEAVQILKEFKKSGVLSSLYKIDNIPGLWYPQIDEYINSAKAACIILSTNNFGKVQKNEVKLILSKTKTKDIQLVPIKIHKNVLIEDFHPDISGYHCFECIDLDPDSLLHVACKVFKTNNSKILNNSNHH